MRDLGTISSHLSTMSLSTVRSDESDVVFLAGHLDLNTGPQVQEALLGAAGLDAPRLVLELSGLELLDSSGIRALVLVHRALEERGTRLAFVTSSAHLRKLFKISGLDTVVAVHDTLEQALEDDPDDFEPLTAG